MNPQIYNSSLEDHQIDINPSIYQQGVTYAQFLLSKKKKKRKSKVIPRGEIVVPCKLT